MNEVESKMELLRLSVNRPEHEQESDALIEMWKQRFPSINQVVEFDGFLELSVAE